MAVIRANGVAGKLSADLAIGGTSMSSAGLADLPAVASPDIAKVTLFQTDANGRVTKQEIVYVTAHTAAATTATIAKGKETTSDQAWNGTTAPDSWVHAETANEPGTLLASLSYGGASDYTTTSFAYVKVDATNLVLTFVAPPSGTVIFDVTATVNNSGGLNWGIGQTAAEEVGCRVTGLATDMNLASTFFKTGLTPGTAYTYYLWFSVGASGTSTIRGNTFAPVTMEVWAA